MSIFDFQALRSLKSPTGFLLRYRKNISRLSLLHSPRFNDAPCHLRRWRPESDLRCLGGTLLHHHRYVLERNLRKLNMVPCHDLKGTQQQCNTISMMQDQYGSANHPIPNLIAASVVQNSFMSPCEAQYFGGNLVLKVHVEYRMSSPSWSSFVWIRQSVRRNI